jgi:hypothetical protein
MSSAVIAKGECMSGTDIFLSYARTDRAAARMFAEAFIDEGFRVWWDAVLHSGETFDEVIEQTLADRRNKLVPAIIEPCDRPIIFELTHAADLSEWTGDITDIRWRTFVEDVRRHVEARDRESAAAIPPGGRAKPLPAHPAEEVPDPAQAESRHAPRREAVHEKPERKHPEAAIPRLHAAGHELDDDDDDGSDEVHCLEIEAAELPEGLFLIDSSGLKIGRTAPADIVLSHKSISREHCIIGLASDELLVTDLNSTNGTYIDDTRIRRATILPVGSILRLGQISLKHSICTRAEALARSNAIGAASLQAGPLALTS